MELLQKHIKAVCIALQAHELLSTFSTYATCKLLAVMTLITLMTLMILITRVAGAARMALRRRKCWMWHRILATDAGAKMCQDVPRCAKMCQDGIESI